MPFESQRNTKIMKPSAILVALLASALTVVGCGSSSPTKSQVQAAHPTASASNPDIGQAQAQVSVGAAPAATSTPNATVSHPSSAQKARPQPGSINDSHGISGPKPLNPCTLVSVSQANAITGGAVLGRVEAPLGPTCIYHLGNAKSDVTVAIESMSFSQVAHQMRRRNSVVVNGRRGFCGSLGTQMLFLPLPGGRILNVTAPCPQAQRFAAAALIHIAA